MWPHSEQNVDSELNSNATEVLQQILSRKKVLAAHSGSFYLQPSQPDEGRGAERSPAGGLERDIAAMLGNEQLAEQEAELLSGIVQQALAEHAQSSTHSQQHSIDCGSSDAKLASSQQQLVQLQQVCNAAAPAAVGITAGEAAAASAWEITAAEQALEQELRELGILASPRTAAVQSAAAAGAPAYFTRGQQKRTSAASGDGAHPLDPYAASDCDSRFSSCNGTITTSAAEAGAPTHAAATADTSAAVTAAQALDIALEDPNASVEDIVGILNYVLDLSTGDHTNRSTIAAGDMAAGCRGSVQALGLAGAGASASKPQQSSSNETAAEMASRLLEQARSAQSAPSAAAAAAERDGQVQAVALQQHAAAVGGIDEAQQGASASLRAWMTEGGLIRANGRPATADSRGYAPAAAAGSPCAWATAATQARAVNPSTPPKSAARVAFHTGGTYAGRVSARSNRSPCRTAPQDRGQKEPWMTPAEIEKAWKGGLRGGQRGAAQQQQEQEQDAAGASNGSAAALAAKYAAVQAGFDSGQNGPQEWTGYDSLLNLQQQVQQQPRGGSSSSGGPGASSGGSFGANAYKAKFTPDLDAKLQRLYERNVDWRRRCEMAYARQRHTEQQEELQGCTFHPAINKKSERIVQQSNMRYPIKTVRPVNLLADAPDQQQQQQQLRQRPASTGRLNHNRQAAGQQPQQQGPHEQHAAAIRAAAAAAGVLGEEAGRELMDQMLAAAAAAAAGQQNTDSCAFSPDGASRKGGRAVSSPSAPAVAQRLYDHAFVKRDRQAQVEEVTKETERRARSWSAPRDGAYRDVAPRVYNFLMDGAISPRQARHVQTGLDECTFHPNTNVGRSKFPDRPKSALPGKVAAAALAAWSAAQRGRADENQSGMKQQQQRAAPRDRQQQRSSSSDRTESPQQQQQQRLDGSEWEEFIERQGMFLLVKEAKRAHAEAWLRKNTTPELSPGSKRILKEKQRMNKLRGTAGSLDAAYQQHKQRQQQQQHPYHVTAQTLPSSFYFHPEMNTASAAVGSSPDDIGSVTNSPGGSQCSGGSPYLIRVQQQHSSASSPVQSSPNGSPGSSDYHHDQLQASYGSGSVDRGGVGRAGACGQPFSFKPAITRKAAAKKARSVEEMSEGDRLRREAKLEQLRIMAEARRLAGVTFMPDMSPTRSRGAAGYDAVKPKISLRPQGLEAYMSSLEQKRREKAEKREKRELQQQEEELAECTFKPMLTPLPAYLSAMSAAGYTARYIEDRMANAVGCHPWQHLARDWQA